MRERFAVTSCFSLTDRREVQTVEGEGGRGGEEEVQGEARAAATAGLGGSGLGRPGVCLGKGSCKVWGRRAEGLPRCLRPLSPREQLRRQAGGEWSRTHPSPAAVDRGLCPSEDHRGLPEREVDAALPSAQPRAWQGTEGAPGLL